MAAGRSEEAVSEPETCIVQDWLKSMRLAVYSEAFLDNGYDDLEICKQIGEEDLDAIGVKVAEHRRTLIKAVQTLKEKGGTCIYFVLEEDDGAALSRKEASYSTYMYDDELQSLDLGESVASALSIDDACRMTGHGQDQSMTLGGQRRLYENEYEEGKAQLATTNSHLHLKRLLAEKIVEDGIRLDCLPYTKTDGSPGFLGGLASSYARELELELREVEEQLEELRWQQLEEISECTLLKEDGLLSNNAESSLFKPGKYLPSSCLSDQEEDQIYAYGFNVYGHQKLKRFSQQSSALSQRCLSPGSAEGLYQKSHFPFDAKVGLNGKKKNSLGKLFRSLGSRKDRSKSTTKPDHLKCIKSSRVTCVQTSIISQEKGCDNVGIWQAIGNEEMLKQQNEMDSVSVRPCTTLLSSWTPELHCRSPVTANCSVSRLGTVAQDQYGTTHWYDDPPYESDPEHHRSSAVKSSKQQHCLFTKAAKYRYKSRAGKNQNFQLKSVGDNSCDATVLLPLCSPREDAGDSLAANGSIRLDPLKPCRGSTSASDDGFTQSSEDEIQDFHQPKSVNHHTNGGKANNFVGRVRGFRDDVKKKISKLRATARPDKEPQENHEVGLHCSSSSVESDSASSFQAAATTSNSNCSSSSWEEGVTAVAGCAGPCLGKAKALVDYTPSPYDKDALKFQKGDIIDILSMSPTGLWKGVLHDRVGHFKFINVELLPKLKVRPPCALAIRPFAGELKPNTVEKLLQQFNVQMYFGVFVLNGYEDLDLFKELEEEDLDILEISNVDHRKQILNAVEFLQGFSYESGLLESHPSDEKKNEKECSRRDSGCYASRENLVHCKEYVAGMADVIVEPESGIHSSDGVESHSNDLGIIVGEDHTLVLPQLNRHKSLKANPISLGETVDRCHHALFNIPPISSQVPQSREDFEQLSSHETPFKEVNGTWLPEPVESRTAMEQSNNRCASARVIPSPPNGTQTGILKQGFFVGSPNNFLHTVPCASALTREQCTDQSRSFSCSPSIKLLDSTHPKQRNLRDRRFGGHTIRDSFCVENQYCNSSHTSRPDQVELESLLLDKLICDGIDLAHGPYTTAVDDNHGIPLALVQKYAKELEREVQDVADALNRLCVSCLYCFKVNAIS